MVIAAALLDGIQFTCQDIKNTLTVRMVIIPIHITCEQPVIKPVETSFLSALYVRRMQLAQLLSI